MAGMAGRELPDDGKHWCPYPGCHRRCPQDRLACRAHWFTVSTTTRREVWSAWEGGSAAEHLAARNKAVLEMHAHYQRKQEQA